MGMRQRFTVKELPESKAPDTGARTILVESPREKSIETSLCLEYTPRKREA